MEQWRTFPGVAGRPKLPQERNDNSSRRSQKTPQQHPKNLGPHLPQLRTWKSCCDKWNHEFCCLPKNPKKKENVRSSVCDLKLKRTWVLQQDNHPKHTSKSTSEWLKKNKMKTLEWPSQSPDLNPIEMLWHDLKKVVHARKPSNVAELQHFCKDEWAKIPPQRCNRLSASYGKRLIAVVAAKGGPTSY
ncbi:hypothetical protein QTP86_016749 [Hemibagrus guttatus]|nr:hypothetical protein QTP86_016749 [Hemibagrus guttatus]